MESLKIFFLSAVLVICAILAYRYPRQGLWAFLIYLPFDGTFAPTVLSVFPVPIFLLAKDLLYIPALIAILQIYRRERRPIPIPRFLLAVLAILLIMALLTVFFVNGQQQLVEDGNEQPILMGIWGLKVLIGYVPLILCGHYLMRNRQDFYFLMRLTLVLIVVVCSLALIQYLLLRTGYCSSSEVEGLFKASFNARCFVGGTLLYSPSQGQIRLPGTFSSPSQWGWFLIFSGFLTFSATFNDPQVRWRVLGFISFILVVVTAVLTGHMLTAGIVLVTFLLLMFFTSQRVRVRSLILIGLGLAAWLGSVIFRKPVFLRQHLDFLQDWWEASQPLLSIGYQFEWVINSMHGWLGHGLGRATNSARFLGKINLIQIYYAKLLYEIGPLGLLAFLALVTGLTYTTLRACRRLRDRRLRNYGLALWGFILFISYHPYYYPLDVNPIAVYYWFFAGVILALPEFEQPAISAPDPPE